MPASPDQTSPWAILADYAARQHANQILVRDRLDKRADTLVTTSGGLVTLVAAATALIPKPKGLQVPTSVVVLLLIGLAMFLITVFLSQLGWVKPRYISYKVIEKIVERQTEIARISDDTDPNKVLRQVVWLDLEISRHTQIRNSVRIRQLRWASVAQMTAVSFLVAAAGLLLIETQL